MFDIGDTVFGYAYIPETFERVGKKSFVLGINRDKNGKWYVMKHVEEEFTGIQNVYLTRMVLTEKHNEYIGKPYYDNTGGI